MASEYLEKVLTDPAARQQALYAGPAVLGLVTHLICNRFEPQSVPFIGSVLAGTFTLAGALSIGVNEPVLFALKQSFEALAIFLVTLATSIVIYRNSPLHPLYGFPGPFLARTTQLWFFWANFKKKPRLALTEAHRKYGDFVRIGPNELSINNVDAITPIHGSRGWPKTHSYEVGLLTSADKQEDANLLSQRFHGAHAERRKKWDKGFSSAAIVEYTPFLLKRNQELMLRLSERAGQDIDFHQWNGYFVYDLMSDLAFGGGFELLEKGEDPIGLLPVIVLANSLHGLIDSLQWLKGIFELLPSSAAIDRVFKFSRGRFEERAAKGSKAGIKDVFSYLLAEDTESGKPLPYEVLAKESQLIVGAGSDTTRATITIAMFYLTQHQDVYKRLQAEMDQLLKTETFSLGALDKAPLLNGVVNEALRLLPPITTGAKRESPGAVICDRWIPKGTPVRTPNYTIAHDPRYFSPGPDAFRPDRWVTPKNEQAFNREASFPFLKGPFGCIGKVVAMHEIRLVLGSMAATFDTQFAPGYDMQKFYDGIGDRFVAEFDYGVHLTLAKRRGVDHGIADMAL